MMYPSISHFLYENESSLTDRRRLLRLRFLRTRGSLAIIFVLSLILTAFFLMKLHHNPAFWVFTGLVVVISSVLLIILLFNDNHRFLRASRNPGLIDGTIDRIEYIPGRYSGHYLLRIVFSIDGETSIVTESVSAADMPFERNPIHCMEPTQEEYGRMGKTGVRGRTVYIPKKAGFENFLNLSADEAEQAIKALRNLSNFSADELDVWAKKTTRKTGKRGTPRLDGKRIWQIANKIYHLYDRSAPGIPVKLLADRSLPTRAVLAGIDRNDFFRVSGKGFHRDWLFETDEGDNTAENWILANDRKRPLVEYDTRISTEARGKGEVVGWLGFRKGVFRKPGILEYIILYTTMITDVGTELWKKCREWTPTIQRKVIKPNSTSSTYFMISYFCDDYTVYIERYMKSRKTEKLITSPLSMPAENPRNYNVEIKIKDTDGSYSSRIIEHMRVFCRDRRFIVKNGTCEQYY